MQPRNVTYVWNLRQVGGNPELCVLQGKILAGQKHVEEGDAGQGTKVEKKLMIATESHAVG